VTLVRNEEREPELAPTGWAIEARVYLDDEQMAKVLDVALAVDAMPSEVVAVAARGGGLDELHRVWAGRPPHA
jgi:hypothetical protein